MTNPATENQKEHDWIEDHQQHHHRGEVINADTGWGPLQGRER
jgi:hypothetical protein